jgi:hypothetical protein
MVAEAGFLTSTVFGDSMAAMRAAVDKLRRSA